jgi:CheY-like chemotaxis protein
MSHELRTPMGGMFGMVELLRKTPLGREQAEYVAGLENSGRHLLHIINDVLDYTKIEVGKLTLEAIPFDLAEVVHVAARLFAEQAAAKGIELAAIVPPRLCGEATGDPGRVKQILANLIGNAVKFTERGHVLVLVSGTAAGIRCEVRDSGAGIAADVEAKLFKPFAQADASTTRRYGGTGLGLTIVKQLVDLMGGTIGFTTTPGVGTTFALELPLKIAAAAEPQVRLSGEALVLARHPLLGAAIAETLRAHGLRAAVVGNVQDAQTAGAHQYLVADLGPADVAGLNFVKASRAPSKVVLTPFGTSVPDELGLSLMKPVRLDFLPAALRRAGVEAEEAPRAAEPALLVRGRVLIADDNELNRSYAAKVVERLGYQVETAVDGRAAVARATATAFDVILMDCHMPEVDGYEAARQLRAAGVATPIVAVTASILPDERERCLGAGMNDVLVKPVRFEGFRAALAGQCRKAPVAAEPPVLDESLFGEWIETLVDGQPDAADAMLAALAQVERSVEALHASLLTGDAKGSIEVAHKLAGSAALLGGSRLRAVSAQIEARLRAGDLREAAGLSAKVLEEAAAFANLVRERIAA